MAAGKATCTLRLRARSNYFLINKQVSKHINKQVNKHINKQVNKHINKRVNKHINKHNA